MSRSALIAHIEPYSLGDSPEGIVAAGIAGYGGADLNALTCRADKGWRLLGRRRIIIAHWERWWEHGYEPIPGANVPRRPFRDLYRSQALALRSIEGHRTVMVAEEALERCGKYKLVLCLELKPAKYTKAAIRNLIEHAEEIGIPLVFMTIQSYGSTARARRRWEKAAYRRLKLVHDLGGNTMLLYREPVAWSRWAPVLTAIKGTHRGHGEVVVASDLIRKLRREAGWK